MENLELRDPAWDVIVGQCVANGEVFVWVIMAIDKSGVNFSRRVEILISFPQIVAVNWSMGGIKILNLP